MPVMFKVQFLGILTVMVSPLEKSTLTCSILSPADGRCTIRISLTGYSSSNAIVKAGYATWRPGIAIISCYGHKCILPRHQAKVTRHRVKMSRHRNILPDFNENI